MTVNELIAALSELSPAARELQVYAGYDYLGRPRPVDGPQFHSSSATDHDSRSALLPTIRVELVLPDDSEAPHVV